MRGPAAAFIALGLVGVAVNGEAGADEYISVTWPDQGSIKVGMPKSPPFVTVELPGCLTLSVDWANDRATVTKASGGEATALEGAERIRKEGGELVVLMNLNDDEARIILHAESDTGALDSRMARIPIGSCSISHLSVKSPTPEKLQGVTVGVSENIKDLYMQKLGFSG